MTFVVLSIRDAPAARGSARRVAALTLAAILLYGCAPKGDSGGSLAGERTDPPRAEPAGVIGSTVVATPVDARPAAIFAGESIAWADLRPGLAEAAGGLVLEEALLDRLVAAQVEAAGLAVTPDDLVAERRRLLETLDADPNTAIRLLDELRARQGLGATRFEALLRRNAGLRALVRDDVTVTEAALRQAHEAAHGPRRQGRLMTFATLADAQRARDRVEAGAPFGEVAAELSTDASAARGGLLEPITRADASYPDALRRALFALAPGETSAPVLLDGQYALVTLVRTLPGDGVSLETARPDLERRVRLGQERILMDRLARDMLRSVRVTIFDDALRESWQRTRPDARP